MASSWTGNAVFQFVTEETARFAGLAAFSIPDGGLGGTGLTFLGGSVEVGVA